MSHAEKDVWNRGQDKEYVRFRRDCPQTADSWMFRPGYPVLASEWGESAGVLARLAVEGRTGSIPAQRGIREVQARTGGATGHQAEVD